MKGSIRFAWLVLGMITMVACFDSGDTKTNHNFDIVLSEDGTMSPELNVVGGGFAVYFGNKAVLVYDELSFEVEKFYIRSYESNDLFDRVRIKLTQYHFG